MNTWEIVAAGAGLCSAALCVHQSIWCWHFGLVAATLYAWVFWTGSLYAGASLQVIYAVLQIYGWRQWRHAPREQGVLAVARTPRRWLLALIALGAIVTLGLGCCLYGRTDQKLPFADSALTAFSLIAQWMMARKLLENWAFWLAVDVFATGMYCVLGYYPTSLLYAIYFMLAVWGHVVWRRALA